MGTLSSPSLLVLTAHLPISAFFRSVSASFSTTFCFWAAMSSLVFSASLQGKRQYCMKTEQGSSSANKGTRCLGGKMLTRCQQHSLAAMKASSVFSCMSTCIASRSMEGIIPPLYLALVRPHLDTAYGLRPPTAKGASTNRSKPGEVLVMVGGRCVRVCGGGTCGQDAEAGLAQLQARRHQGPKGTSSGPRGSWRCWGQTLLPRVQ